MGLEEAQDAGGLEVPRVGETSLSLSPEVCMPDEWAQVTSPLFPFT